MQAVKLVNMMYVNNATMTVLQQFSCLYVDSHTIVVAGILGGFDSSNNFSASFNSTTKAALLMTSMKTGQVRMMGRPGHGGVGRGAE